MDTEGLPIRVLPMRLRHIPTIADIERTVFSLPWSATAFRYELEHNTASEYLVVQHMALGEAKRRRGLLEPLRQALRSSPHDPSLIAYGGLWVVVDEAHICTIAVRPEWRGRGLGELVLASLIERALERKADVVTLEVRVSNIVAQNLYKKYGFTVVGRRKRYYSDNGEDADIMTTPPIHSEAYQQRFQALEHALRARLEAEFLGSRVPADAACDR